MADITMCSVACPDSHRCKRHVDSGTKPHATRQSYFSPSKTGARHCEMFWEIDIDVQQDKRRLTPQEAPR